MSRSESESDALPALQVTRINLINLKINVDVSPDSSIYRRYRFAADNSSLSLHECMYNPYRQYKVTFRLSLRMTVCSSECGRADIPSETHFHSKAPLSLWHTVTTQTHKLAIDVIVEYGGQGVNGRIIFSN